MFFSNNIYIGQIVDHEPVRKGELRFANGVLTVKKRFGRVVLGPTLVEASRFVLNNSKRPLAKNDPTPMLSVVSRLRSPRPGVSRLPKTSPTPLTLPTYVLLKQHIYRADRRP